MKRNSLSSDKITFKNFILNLNQSYEKVLTWSCVKGFISENSDDEQTNLLRAERQLIRRRAAKYGDKIFLRQRPIKNFETLMLKLGGKEVLEWITGKNIDENITTVYEW